MAGDLTQFYHLPPSGDLAVHCIVPNENEHPCRAVEIYLAQKRPQAVGLYLLPAFDFSDQDLETLAAMARRHQIGIGGCALKEDSARRYFLYTGNKMHQWDLAIESFGFADEFPRVDFGSARLHFLPFSAAAHPEQVVAASKKGCDILIAVEKNFSPQDRLIAGLMTIARVAVCVCAEGGAGIWIPPEGHARWGEKLAHAGAVCRLAIDTGPLRTKNFQDNIDFKVLCDPFA